MIAFKILTHGNSNVEYFKTEVILKFSISRGSLIPRDTVLYDELSCSFRNLVMFGTTFPRNPFLIWSGLKLPKLKPPVIWTWSWSSSHYALKFNVGRGWKEDTEVLLGSHLPWAPLVCTRLSFPAAWWVALSWGPQPLWPHRWRAWGADNLHKLLQQLSLQFHSRYSWKLYSGHSHLGWSVTCYRLNCTPSKFTLNISW